MSKLTNQREQSEEFNTINKQLTKMKDELYELQLLIKQKQKEVKNTKIKLQNVCKHEYKRECTTTGCYAEYEYICIYCRKFRQFYLFNYLNVNINIIINRFMIIYINKYFILLF